MRRWVYLLECVDGMLVGRRMWTRRLRTHGTGEEDEFVGPVSGQDRLW